MKRFVLVAALTATLACEKTVSVKLDLVEPCDQKSQALNGVKVFRVTASDELIDPVVFPATAPEALRLPLTKEGDPPSIVQVEGFDVEPQADLDTLVASTPPRSIGRTMPIEVTPETKSVDVALLMGQVDTFAKTTDRAGECRALTEGATGPRGRHGHTATFVPGENKVLIVGGAVWVDDGAGGLREQLLGTVELYDPATGTFETLNAMPRGETRAYHTATALADGRVFIAGGFSELNGVPQARTESTWIWDPRQPEAMQSGPALDRGARAHHTATYLERANIVVLVGGCAGDGCTFGAAAAAAGVPSTQLTNYVQVFDVAGNRVLDVTTGVARRAFHAASAIGPTRILVSGGATSAGPVCSVEIFEVDSGTVRPLDVPGLNVTFEANDCPVRHAQVTVVENPLKVAIIGGQTTAPGGAVVDESGVATGTPSPRIRFFTSAGLEILAAGATPQTLQGARVGHYAAVLPNGHVLVVGGTTPGSVPTAERFIVSPTSTAVQNEGLRIPFGGSRDRAAAVVMGNGEVMFTGGYTTTTPVATVDDADIYFPAARPLVIADPAAGP